MGFQNFYVITRYNRSLLYAMAVNDLADAIAERYRATPDRGRRASDARSDCRSLCRAALAACSASPPRPAVTAPASPTPFGAGALHAAAAARRPRLPFPTPVPRIEPRSTRGNPVSYEVFGKRYFLLPTAEGYKERGVASWYGPDFHAAPPPAASPTTCTR